MVIKLSTLLFFLYSFLIFAQPTFITRGQINPEFQINEQIFRLERFLNTGNINDLEVDSVHKFITNELLLRNNRYTPNRNNSLKYVKIYVEKIKIKENTADVVTNFSFVNENDKVKEQTVTLLLVKKNNWKFSNIGSFEHLFLDRLESDNPVTDGFTNIQPVTNEFTFYKIPVFTPQGQSPVYELNYQTTEEVFNKQVFAANQGLSWAGWYWGPNPYGQYYKLALILDHDWRRIVFSKDALDGAVRLYDYGRSQGNLEFASPRAIDMNEFNEIFIADESAKSIYKLNYNYFSNTITAPSQPIFISNLNYISKPVDIDYYSGTTYNSRADDRIVIADQGLNCISIFDGLGNYKGKITHFYVSGYGYIQITEPRSAVLFGFENPYRIAFIDGGTNSLVCGTFNENNTSITPFIPPAKFEGYSKLYNIGVDGCYNLLVTDLNGQLIHKFSKSGKYSCSFNLNNEIINPYYASNVVDNCNYDSHAMHFYIGAAWGRNNGITEYLPGGDALNLQNINHNSYYRFQFTSTDEMIYKVELVKASNLQVIHLWDNQFAYTSETKFFTHPQDGSMPNGTYFWRVTYKPMYDDFYGQYQVGWHHRQLWFNHTNYAPVFASVPFTQSPNSICRASSGNVYVHLSQGNGTLHYTWTPHPSNLQYSPHNDYCTVWLPPAGMNPENEIFALDCTVWNNWGTASRTYTINWSICSGCPTLAFEPDSARDSGGGDENPLLISSTSYPTEDVVDYYLIQSDIAPIKGEIHFSIREPATEHTWLDQAQLIEVEVEQNQFVAVTDNGEIINYLESTSPVTVILNDSIEVTEYLSSQDENTLNFFPGDMLTIQTNEVAVDANIVIVIDGFVVAKDITADVMFIPSGGGEEDLGDFYLRPNVSSASLNLGSLGEGIIKMIFYQEGTLNYLTLINDLNTADIETLVMTSAEHSESGSVIELVDGQPDQQYSEIYPGQSIDFTFREGGHSLPNIRYVLKTVGRYETDTTDANQRLAKTTEEIIVPKENKLYDNYPNPFNPTTQIKFAVKESGLVNLKVYDVLGNEVAILVNENKQAGIYTVNFDASYLSSGIYFYTISAKDFNQTKKMILIK